MDLACVYASLIWHVPIMHIDECDNLSKQVQQIFKTTLEHQTMCCKKGKASPPFLMWGCNFNVLCMIILDSSCGIITSYSVQPLFIFDIFEYLAFLPQNFKFLPLKRDCNHCYRMLVASSRLRNYVKFLRRASYCSANGYSLRLKTWNVRFFLSQAQFNNLNCLLWIFSCLSTD